MIVSLGDKTQWHHECGWKVNGITANVENVSTWMNPKGFRNKKKKHKKVKSDAYREGVVHMDKSSDAYA